MIAAGKYLANIKDYGVSESSTGKPRIEIQFVCKDAMGTMHTVYWYGYVTDKSLFITAKALVNCGLKGTNYDDLSKGISSGLLDTERPVEIDVQHEEFKGKIHAKIAWINRPSGAQFLDPQMGAMKLKGLNLGAVVAEARSKTGIKDPKDELGF